jgi:hypothetical protein
MSDGPTKAYQDRNPIPGRKYPYYAPIHPPVPDATGDSEALAPIIDPTIPNLSEPRERLYAEHKDLCTSALELMLRKNADYASQADPFRNFRMFGGLGVLVRASDKLARLRTFEERETFSVTDESLRDTILDLINYAVIYYAMKREGK